MEDEQSLRTLRSLRINSDRSVEVLHDERRAYLMEVFSNKVSVGCDGHCVKGRMR